MDITFQVVLSAVSAILTGVVGYLIYKIKKREDTREKDEAEKMQSLLMRDEAIDRALCALCRDRILQGYRYYEKNGEVSTQDLETMSKLYKAYHNLGGNGTITVVYEKIRQLPIKSGV